MTAFKERLTPRGGRARVRVRAAGINAVLIGETLMRAKNILELSELLLKE